MIVDLAALRAARQKTFEEWANCPTSQHTREFALSLRLEEQAEEIAELEAR